MSFTFLHPALPPLGRISLGCATFGREIGEDAAFAMMDHARAHGVTLFDTAAGYSDGASERIVGAWLASRRPAPGSLAVATKMYPPFTLENINESVERSAGRLGVSSLDVLYLHKWDSTLESPGVLQGLDALVKEARVRVLGASNFDAARLARALDEQRDLGLEPFRVLQNNHNVAVRDVDAALLELSASRGVALVTYSPLGAGFLTGKHRDGVERGSRFDIVPGHQNVYFNAEAGRRLEKLAEVAARTGHAMAHLALAWALHQLGIGSVLIGGRTTAHLDQAFNALALDDPALFAELESA